MNNNLAVGNDLRAAAKGAIVASEHVQAKEPQYGECRACSSKGTFLQSMVPDLAMGPAAVSGGSNAVDKKLRRTSHGLRKEERDIFVQDLFLHLCERDHIRIRDHIRCIVRAIVHF